jgi:hypothetical protein
MRPNGIGRINSAKDGTNSSIGRIYPKHFVGQAQFDPTGKLKGVVFRLSKCHSL